MSELRVATDVGGTFTDLVYYLKNPDTGEFDIIRTGKVETTPPAFENGVINVIEKAGIRPKDFEYFAHGTTVVINSLLSRDGAKTALLTTRGFRDILEIARGNRPDLFNFRFRKPPPFVERYLRREIDERTEFDGTVTRTPDHQELEAIIRDFREQEVEAIAVCFLHSYANPENEENVCESIKTLWPGISVVPSHRVTREWREYERTSTAVLSAYIHPSANRYLENLQDRLSENDFDGEPFIMQSNGGVATLRSASMNPIMMLESGPSSGMLGAAAMGTLIGEENLIALDVGGTTAKCSLVENGELKITTDYYIERDRTHCGYPIKTTVIDIVEIGNGGGSIAWFDEGKKLNVGPKSAGAVPGPASYGRGGMDPTTTDAHLLTGRIGEDYFMAGELQPDMENVRNAFSPIVKQLDVDPYEAALGVIRIANANMINALGLISVNRGHDPREFTMMAFGGGGPMHAASLAGELGIPKVIIPVNAGVFSAWGMLNTDLRRDHIITNVLRIDDRAHKEIRSLLEKMSRSLIREFQSDGMKTEGLILHTHFDMRYQGQEHTVKVQGDDGPVNLDYPGKLAERFHLAHKKEYSFSLENPVEIVNFHLVGLLPVPRPELPEPEQVEEGPDKAIRTERNVLFDDGKWHVASVYRRKMLPAGSSFKGPAVIEDTDATTLVPAGKPVEIDHYGNIHIQIM